MTKAVVVSGFLLVVSSMAGCGSDPAPASPTDAATDTATAETAVDTGTLDAGAEAPATREEASLASYGCVSRKKVDPPAKACGCSPGSLSVELDGDGERLVLGAAYVHPVNDVCAAGGPALYTLGGCAGQALLACATAGSDRGCLLLVEPPRGGENWVRGHYVDRTGECFELRGTLLDATTDGKTGSVSTGTFKAAAVGSRTLSLTGRFSACTARKTITCE